MLPSDVALDILTGMPAALEYADRRRPAMTLKGGSNRPLLGLLSVGMVLVTCIVLGYFLGRYLDGKLGTEPWLTVAGVLLGTAAGFLDLFRTVSRTLK